MYITDRAYTESQIREMEIKIIVALGFELRPPREEWEKFRGPIRYLIVG